MMEGLVGLPSLILRRRVQLARSPFLVDALLLPF